MTGHQLWKNKFVLYLIFVLNLLLPRRAPFNDIKNKIVKLQHARLPRFSEHFQQTQAPLLGTGYRARSASAAPPSLCPCAPGGVGSPVGSPPWGGPAGPRGSEVASAAGSFRGTAHTPPFPRAESGENKNLKKRQADARLIAKRRSILLMVNRSFSSILSKRPGSIILGFDVPSVPYREKLP